MERLQELNALVERKAKERSARYAGRVEQVLVEGINPKDAQQVMGRTRTNRLTFFPAAKPGNSANQDNSTKQESSAPGTWQPGDLVDVRIEQVRAFSLSGTLA